MSTPPWFYAPAPVWSATHVVLPLDESRHALEVLRLGAGDAVVAFDGRGLLASGPVEAVEEGRAVVGIRTTERRSRPQPAIVVYQGAPKGSKLDGIVEHLAGMGVAAVHAFHSERSVVKWDSVKQARIAQRWRALAVSAAKQSRNPWITEVGPPLPWAGLIAEIDNEPCPVVLWEEATVPLRRVLDAGAPRTALVVGPEGGLSHSEIDALRAAGARPASLGAVVLRTEMAPVVGVAVVGFHLGLIG